MRSSEIQSRKLKLGLRQQHAIHMVPCTVNSQEPLQYVIITLELQRQRFIPFYIWFNHQSYKLEFFHKNTFFFLSSSIYHPPCRIYIPKLQPKCPWVRYLHTMDQNSRRRASLNLWSAECHGHRQRPHSTEHKGHSLSTRIETKILDPFRVLNSG